MGKEVKYINVVRFIYDHKTSIGRVTLTDIGAFCYSLEDAVRAYGIKIKGRTAIANSPVDGFKVGIRFSNSFQRDMVCLYTEDDKVTLKFGGISFGYIYFHGGNTPEDTEGCILIAKNIDEDNMTIQGSKEKDLIAIVKRWFEEGFDVRCIITTRPYTDVN